MDTTQMKYFITAAICLNFTEAAAQLYITQPTLSRHINAIESELNVQLFLRDNRSLRLTPAGEYLFDKLSGLYGEYCEIVEQTRDKSFVITGTLNIGVLDGMVVGGLLAGALDSIHHRYPSVRINLQRGSFKALADGLYKSRLDVIMTLEFDVVKRTKIEYQVLERAGIFVAMRATNPLSSRESLTLGDLAKERLICLSPEDCPEASALLIEGCTREGFYPRNCVYAPDQGACMLMVEAGLGVAVISGHNVLGHVPGVRLVPLQKDWPSGLVAAWHQDSPAERIRLLLKEFPTSCGDCNQYSTSADDHKFNL